MFLTRAAVRNPILILMVCIAVVVLSQVALSRLPVDLFPSITLPVITVSTTYTGANPEDLERSVTYPLEQAVRRVAGVQRIISFSRQGTSVVQLWFNWGQDLNSAQVEVIQNVQRVMRTLPPGVSQPFVVKFDVSNIAVVQVVLSGGGLDNRQLYSLAVNTIAPQLEQIPGVAQSFIRGGLLRQINVNVDPHKMAATGLSLREVTDTITRYNSLVAAGAVRNTRLDYQLRVPTLVQDVPAINNITLATRARIPVRIGDIAEVEDAAADQTQIVRVDGRPGVVLSVLRQPGANTIQVVDNIRKTLPNLAGVPQGVELRVSFDQSRYIREAIKSLTHEAFIGAILTFLVVLVFLPNLWNLFIIGLGIPLSVASALLSLYFTGQTLNVFTLGGLTLAMGRLVDDAIVVRENITRHLHMPGKRSVTQAVLDATNEVGVPVLASTMTMIAVFFPVVFLTGIAQRLFVPMALTIVFAMIASYFVSMTVDPVLSIRLMRTRPGREDEGGEGEEEGNGRLTLMERVERRSEQLLERLDAWYVRTLDWVLHHRRIVLAAIALVFVLSLLAARRIGTEFFPDTDESQFTVSLRTQEGTAVRVTEAMVQEAAAIVRRIVPREHIVTVITDAGVPPNAVFASNAGPNAGRVEVRLVPPTQRTYSTEQMANRIRRAVEGRFPGTQTFVSTGGLQRRIVNFGSEAPIDVQILGYDQAMAAQLAQQVAGLVASAPGTADVQVNPRGRYPAFNVRVDREKAAQFGLTPIGIATAVSTAMSGNVGTASKFIDPITGEQYEIVVRLGDRYRGHVDDLVNVPLMAITDAASPAVQRAGATAVLLRNVASITLDSMPLEITRKNGQRVIDITANVVGRPLGQVSEEIRGRLERIRWPVGFSYHMAGQTEQQQSAFGSLGFTTLLALMLVYMIMASQFKSLLDPFVIMFTVPLGLMGVIWMMLLTRTTFSIMAFMGVITMVGVVVSNGILLVDYANKQQNQGVALYDAILAAGRIRLRPILMTAIATIAGMIPMALGMGEGSETNAPLARAVIGGLSVSTVLTLLLIPVLYVLFEERLRRRHSEESEA